MKRAARLAIAIVALSALPAWAALAPVRFDTREETFEIPKGVYAKRMAGEPIDILPQEIHLMLGVRDVLLLKNHDEVPQIFGPTVMMPGQSFRLPFAVASTYSFECSAHPSGQMQVVVHPAPDTPWARLRWRASQAWRAIS